MSTQSILTLALACFGLLSCARKQEPKVVGTEVHYAGGGITMKGYLAVNEAIGEKRPGILVVNEWWGHNEYARRRARMLAELGYAALAVDMYGEGKQAAHPSDAGTFASEVMKNMESAKARFIAAMDLLKSNPACDSSRIAAIGYCFGGGVVLQMARMGADLKGVVSFHGSLATPSPARPGEVKARVLVCNCADDGFVTAEAIEMFKNEMQSAGVNYTFVSYQGAKHSFTNPDADKFGKEFNLPLAYNEAADRQSWADMQRFFKEAFGE